MNTQFVFELIGNYLICLFIPAPTYKVDRENLYSGIDMDLEKHQERPAKITTELVQPVYATGDQEKMAVNHFKEVVIHAEMIRLMQGPIYDVDRNHHFEQLLVHASELKKSTKVTKLLQKRKKNFVKK